MSTRKITVLDEPESIYRFIEAMTYKYETDDTRVLMETVRQGAKACFGAISDGSSLMEMACSREQLIGKLKHHTKDFIRWWCLLRYFSKYGDPNGLVNHERGKWISLATELCALTSTDGNTQRIKKKFLGDYWKRGTRETPGEDYDTSPEKVISVIYSKFADEGISDPGQITDIATEFSANVDELIRIISSGSFADVLTHADSWFPATVEPQKPKRTRRNRRRQ